MKIPNEYCLTMHFGFILNPKKYLINHGKQMSLVNTTLKTHRSFRRLKSLLLIHIIFTTIYNLILKFIHIQFLLT